MPVHTVGKHKTATQKFTYNFVAIFLSMMVCFCCIGQTSRQVDSVNIFLDTSNQQNHFDTTLSVTPVRKHFYRASGQLLLMQVVPWSFNYFVRRADFAKISLRSLSYNLAPKHWEWDDNKFLNNQFSHPYHGNLYFNSFRSNGYSFWQSAPAAFAGSLLWELAAETHPPSQNDFMNTSLGGISLGEMTYRLSNRIVNERKRGFKRQVQEVFALLVNPMNGLSRIADGKWGRVRSISEDTLDVPLSGSLDIGSRRFSSRIKDVFDKGNSEVYIRVNLQYGKPYEPTRTPFRSFSVLAEVGAADSGYLNTLSVNAVLAQWAIKKDSNKSILYSISMNYDFFHNSSFEYGAQSFSFDIISSWNFLKKVKFFGKLGGGIIPIAAVPDDYLYYGEGRDYDYGPGVGIDGSITLCRNKFYASVAYRGGWFKTINGTRSSFFMNAASGMFRYDINRNFHVGFETGHFSLYGYYRDYEDVYKRYPFIRVSAGISLFDKTSP